MVRSARLALVLACATCFAVSPRAQRGTPVEETWGHWRGPFHTGVAPGEAPTEWSDTRNVAWKIEVPGRGHSSPVVWGDRIFITTAVPTGRTIEAPPEPELPAGRGGRGGRGRGGRFGGDGGAGAREEHRFEVMAIDRASGKVIWQHTPVTTAPHEGYHHMYGSFASNSPTTDGERVYASFGSRGLFVYDMNGKLLWQKDFEIQMRMFNGFGEGVGPVLDDGRIIMLFDHEDEGFLTMLDAATGRELWRVPRSDRTNWAAPLVVTHDGRKQVVVNSARMVRGYDYETGKAIWEAAGLGANTIPRAVQHEGLVLVMSGFRNPQLMAIRLGREGNLTDTDAIVWRADRGLSYTSSPALHEGILHFVTDNGMVSALNASTGEPLYQQVRLPKPYNFKASVVAAGGNLYFSTEEGEVLVAKIGRTLDIIATNVLADQSFVATPAIAGGDIYLRSRTHLFRISE